MLKLPRPEPTSRVRQLERPQEIARLLEIGPHGHNLMDQILDADDAEFAKVLLDDLVVGERDSLLVNLSIASLVDEVADALYRGIAVRDVGFDYFEHFGGGFGDFDKDAVVDLEETEELHDLAGFGGHLVDTRETY